MTARHAATSPSDSKREWQVTANYKKNKNGQSKNRAEHVCAKKGERNTCRCNEKRGNNMEDGVDFKLGRCPLVVMHILILH